MSDGVSLTRLVRDLYVEEMRLAAQMMDHAARLRYPQYRVQLEGVAREESGHAAQLKGWIEKRGESADSPIPPPKEGRNDWERLRQDYEDDLAQADRYLRSAYRVDAEDPQLAGLFLRIRNQERSHRDILLRLVMRHDCYDS